MTDGDTHEFLFLLFCVTWVLFSSRVGEVMMDPDTHGNSQSDIIRIIGS